MHANGIRLRIVGDLSRFDDKLQKMIANAERKTEGNTRMTVTICANYGGRQDIAAAARALARDVAEGRLVPEDIDEATFASRVALADLPPPDLFIRTGGDMRISNFLLWQLAYTELWFTDTLWPELDAATLARALDDFARRERRFGLTGEQAAALERSE
jgi:undecaprenyl diphosphate synthase